MARSRTASDQLVERLVDWGIDTVFGVPGDGINGVMESLRSHRGLAGSFGYERGERYDVSIKAGERQLLPRIREASEHTLILTDGFSCHSQISHGSARGALHLAQLIQMALHEGPNGPATAPPERRYAQAPLRARNAHLPTAVAAGATATTLGGIAVLARRAGARKRTLIGRG